MPGADSSVPRAMDPDGASRSVLLSLIPTLGTDESARSRRVHQLTQLLLHISQLDQCGSCRRRCVASGSSLVSYCNEISTRSGKTARLSRAPQVASFGHPADETRRIKGESALLLASKRLILLGRVQNEKNTGKSGQNGHSRVGSVPLDLHSHADAGWFTPPSTARVASASSAGGRRYVTSGSCLVSYCGTKSSPDF